jgi:hypothetical protein
MADRNNVSPHARYAVPDTLVVWIGNNCDALLTQAKTGMPKPIDIHRNLPPSWIVKQKQLYLKESVSQTRKYLVDM